MKDRLFLSSKAEDYASLKAHYSLLSQRPVIWNVRFNHYGRHVVSLYLTLSNTMLHYPFIQVKSGLNNHYMINLQRSKFDVVQDV